MCQKVGKKTSGATFIHLMILEKSLQLTHKKLSDILLAWLRLQEVLPLVHIWVTRPILKTALLQFHFLSRLEFLQEMAKQGRLEVDTGYCIMEGR